MGQAIFRLGTGFQPINKFFLTSKAKYSNVVK